MSDETFGTIRSLLHSSARGEVWAQLLRESASWGDDQAVLVYLQQYFHGDNTPRKAPPHWLNIQAGHITTHPAWSLVNHFALEGLTPVQLETLFSSDKLSSLVSLDLSNQHLSKKSLNNLIKYQYFKTLKNLNLNNSKLNNKDICNLTQSNWLYQLKELNLQGNHFTNINTLHISEHLKSLNISYNPINKLSHIAFFENSNLSNLEHLNLGATDLSDAALRALILKPLPHLEKLSIHYNNLSDKALSPLTSSCLASLAILEAEHNRFTAAGVRHLAQLQRLIALNLEANLLDDAAVKAMLDTKLLSRLERLNLSYNYDITDNALEMLASSDQLSTIKTSLRIDSCYKVTERGVKMLLRADALHHNIKKHLLTLLGDSA